MKNKRLVHLTIAFGLFLMSAVFLAIVATHVEPQATMDAAYYHLMADRLAEGKGFNEPIVWHHLNNYQNVEHPMDYWMPLGIIFYYLSLLIAGPGAQIGLNILLWAILTVAVYFEVHKKTANPFASFVAALCFLFCGRILFYLLTSDNIAFYAVQGFIFFKLLANPGCRWHLTALCAGSIALMRIEGLIFAAVAALIELFKSRKPAVLIGYTLVFLLVLSPWLLRNYQALNTLWPSNTKALFLHSYDDFFSEKFPGTFAYFAELGPQKILIQKVYGLANSFLNLIALPGLFVFYPLWLLGIIFLWQREGKIFTLFLLLFWLLCGLLFTHQSAMGTAMHISAFFLPHFAVMMGAGLHLLGENKIIKEKKLKAIAACLVIWALIFSLGSIKKLSAEYSGVNGPYIKLLKNFKIPSDSCVVSVYPVFINLFAGCKSVMCGATNADDILAMTEKFNCDYIILDRRIGQEKLPATGVWQSIIVDDPLILYRKTTDQPELDHK